MGTRTCSRVVSWLAFFLPIAVLTPCGSWSSPLIVQESQRLTSPDPQFPLNGPVAISGNQIVAGSCVDLQTGFFRCLVFLFERPSATGSWSYTRTLADFTVSDNRGPSHLNLAIAGNTVAVSATSLALVIERTATGWVTTQLTPPAGIVDFGSDIATSGSTIVVGGMSAGSVAGFIYRRNAQGAWPFEARLLGGGSPQNSNQYLGPEVDINDAFVNRGDKVVIGSPQEFGPPVEPGQLYVFRRQDDGRWLELDRPFDPVATSDAGRLATIGGGVAAFDNGLPGGATLFFELKPDGWTWLDSVRALDSLMSGFPFALDVPVFSNGLHVAGRPAVAIGLPNDEDRGPNTGSVTLWQDNSGDQCCLAPKAKFLASNATPGLQLGTWMGLDENADTVIAQGGKNVYIFRVPASFEQPELRQDDFEDGNAAGWLPTSVGWSVVSSHGSRVYRQVKETFDTRSTLTNVDWKNVAIEADVRPLLFNGTDRFAALMTRYTDANNYYYASLRNTNTLRLTKRVNGTFTTLASTSLAVPVNKSYRVRLEAIGTWLRVYVDGRLRLQARDSALKHGTVGFRSFLVRAEFDNVVVSPSPATTLLADAFDGGLKKWTLQPAANWSIVGSGSTAVLRQSVAAGDARAISGIPYEFFGPEVADHVVSARARALSFVATPAQAPFFGLIARYKDDTNFTYLVVNRNGNVSLRKLNNGVIQVLDTAPFTVTTGVWYNLSLEAVGDRLRVYVNGSLVLEGVDPVVDPNSTRGRYGLITSRAAAEFDDVRVTEP